MTTEIERYSPIETYTITYQERTLKDPKFAEFIEGIKRYKLSDKQIEESGFFYAGGDTDQHKKYWDMKYSIRVLRPPHRERCVCDVKIKKNCYITDDNKFFLVIGICCIKRFIPKDKQGKLCSNCEQPHRNRSNNLCNECRLTHEQCSRCRIAVESWKTYDDYGVRTCRPCYMERTYPKCILCNEGVYFEHLIDKMCSACVVATISER